MLATDLYRFRILFLNRGLSAKRAEAAALCLAVCFVRLCHTEQYVTIVVRCVNQWSDRDVDTVIRRLSTCRFAVYHAPRSPAEAI